METIKTFIRVWGHRQIGITVGIAAVVGLTICLQVRQYLWRQQTAVTDPGYLVVRRTLPQGHPVTFLDLTSVSLGDLKKTVPNAMTDQELHLLKDAIVNYTLPKGSVLTKEALRWTRDEPKVRKEKRNGFKKRKRIEVWAENEES